MDAASGCIADEFRYGSWVGGPASAAFSPVPGCGHLQYVNRTCDHGRPFSVRRFCLALRCRSILFAGDSTVRGIFLAIVGEMIANHSRLATVDLTGHWADCGPVHRWERLPQRGQDERASPRLRMPYPVCRSAHCPHGVNLTFIRSDHLDVEGSAFNGLTSNENLTCAKKKALHWMDTLDEEPQLLVMSRGAHVEEYRSVHGRDVRGDAAWHASRAQLLARQLRSKASLGVVFLRPHWGLAEYSIEPKHWKAIHGRNSYAAIPSRYGWDLLPMIGEVTVRELRKGLGDRFLAVDPTLALAQRPDCRLDPLHIRPEVLSGSVLRLLVAACTTWP